MEDVPLIGAQYLGFEGATTEAEIERRSRAMLYRALNIGQTIAFVGSGVSAAYGYPTWREFAEVIVRETVERFGRDSTGEFDVSLSHFLEDRGESTRLNASERTLLVLGICEDHWRREGFAGEFRKLAKRAMQPRKGRCVRQDRDPLRQLMLELRIGRFLTINYDLEIERAFHRVLGVPLASLGVDPQLALAESPGEPYADGDAIWTGTGRPLHSWATDDTRVVRPDARSLPLDIERCESLVQFAVGADPYFRGVFHCHGDEREPGKMLVTERDYQRIYLARRPVERNYRLALDLAFNANSILFVGVGMSEGDLLRPLREFVAEHQNSGRERPLFAVVGYDNRTTLRERIEYRRFFLARYGVKVLFHHVEDGDYTAALCREIRAVAEGWASWWYGWQHKPPLRTPRFASVQGNAMVHHGVHLPTQRLDSKGDETQVVRALDQGKALLVMGRAGSGKGSLGQQLVSGDIQLRRSFDKRFFATTHFANEYLSIIQAATRFFGDVRGKGKPEERLLASLEEGRHLLVVGGVERLLVHGDFEAPDAPKTFEGDDDHPLPMGVPISAEVRVWLNGLAKVVRPDGSNVILTTSILPVGLDIEKFTCLRLHGIDVEVLTRRPGYSGIDERTLQELRYALRGHLYAMSVLGHALEAIPTEERTSQIRRLVARLTAVELPRRAEEAVNWAIRVVRVTFQVPESLVEGVLQSVATFATPVSFAAIATSLRATEDDRPAVEHVIKRLVASDLLMEVDPAHTDKSPRYTAHTVVRTRTLHQLGAYPDVPGEPQRLVLAGFSSEGEEPAVGAGGQHASVARRVDELLEELERPRWTEPGSRRGLIRAAFGLLRSQFAATGVGRRVYASDLALGVDQAPLLEEYVRRLSRLVNIIRAECRTRLWLSEDARTREDVLDEGAPLYADELAWIYNELGLVAYCQGALADAHSLFRVGQDVNIAAECGSFGYRWCQSEMNLALVQIDRARLRRAEYHLVNVLRGERGLEDRDLRGRANGYLGLVYHLSGDYVSAEAHYRRAIRLLRAIENHRGSSIFRRHYGDMLRRKSKFDLAREQINLAVGAAEAGGHPDLLHFCRIADANLKHSLGQSPSQEVLEGTVEFGRAVGMPRLMADAFKVQGHLALERGETELAGQLAMATLSLAMENGMKLRTTAALVFLGRVERRRGRSDAAARLFQAVVRTGMRQGYQSQIEDAERELVEMRLP